MFQKRKKKINEATALFESAYEYLETLDTTEDFDALYVGSIRVETAAAEVDLTEALTILESISYDRLSLEEKEGMDALKVMCHVDIDLCEMMVSDFCDFIDHCQRVSLATDDEVAIDHFREAEAALVRMKEKTTAMRAKMDTVDVERLPPEIKGDYVGMKTHVKEFEKSLEEWVVMMEQILNEPGF